MLNAFYNPAEAVLDAKKFGGWGTTIGVLAIAAVLLALAEIIALKSFTWYVSLAIIVGVAVVVFLGGLFIKIALSILGAKNPGCFEAVSALTYSLAPMSIALLAGSVLYLIPTVGIVLAGLLVLIGGVAMGATQIRAIQELAGTDLLMAVVVSWVVMSIGISFSYLMGFVLSFMTMGTTMFTALP